VHLEKQFDVKQSRDVAVALVAQDDTLLRLFPETRTEIVERHDNRRTVCSHYRALGQEGTATFRFEFDPSGDVCFEKVCDGRVWRELTGVVSFETRGKGTRVRIVMDGRTRALVPEFTIRGAMQEQIEQMATALRRRLEQA
jgi:hypothetical protein